MEPNEQNKQMSKIEPEAWNQGTNWQGPEGKKEGGKGREKEGKKGRKKEKGLVKEQE